MRVIVRVNCWKNIGRAVANQTRVTYRTCISEAESYYSIVWLAYSTVVIYGLRYWNSGSAFNLETQQIQQNRARYIRHIAMEFDYCRKARYGNLPYLTEAPVA